MKAWPVVALAISVAVTGCGKRRQVNMAGEDIINIYVTSRSGWGVKLDPDGSGRICIDKLSAPFGRGTLDFAATYERIAPKCVADSTGAAYFSAGFRRPSDFRTDGMPFSDEQVAKAVFEPAFKAAMALRDNAEMRRLYVERPPVPHNPRMQQDAAVKGDGGDEGE